MAAVVDDLTPTHEAAVVRMVPLDAVVPGQNVEFTDAQKLCSRELHAEIDKTLYRCIMDNLRGQANREATTFNAKDKGYKLLQHLNFIYRGDSTANTAETVQQNTDFSSWFPPMGDPKDSLIRFQELNLATFERHSIPDAVQCKIVIAALNKNLNYHILSASLELDSNDAGTIKLEDLCNKIARFYNDTHKGWGFNVTAEEHGFGKRNGATRESLQQQNKKLEQKVNSMQARMNQIQGKPGGANGSIFSRQKRSLLLQWWWKPWWLQESQGFLCLLWQTLAILLVTAERSLLALSATNVARQGGSQG